MTDTNKALMALMDLVLAMVDVLEAPTATQANKAQDKVLAERREVEGWRETLYLLSTEANRRRLEAATRQRQYLEVSQDGQAAIAAVEATERRLRAWQGLDPIEADDNRLTQPFRETHEARLASDPAYAAAWAADDSRVTDGHQCCGGKPDCGCSRSVGG